MNTVVVNLYAGPGAGKTNTAWEIAAQLKRDNVLVEYVPEYAKELVWENRMDLLDGSFENQILILREQMHRQERLQGKVQAIVTDAPLLLNPIYAKEKAQQLAHMARKAYMRFENIDLFVRREKEYMQAGRMQTLEQSLALDGRIQDMLEKYGIAYGECCRANRIFIVEGIERSLAAERRLSMKARADRELEL